MYDITHKKICTLLKRSLSHVANLFPICRVALSMGISMGIPTGMGMRGYGNCAEFLWVLWEFLNKCEIKCKRIIVVREPPSR